MSIEDILQNVKSCGPLLPIMTYGLPTLVIGFFFLIGDLKFVSKEKKYSDDRHDDHMIPNWGFIVAMIALYGMITVITGFLMDWF